MKRPYMEDDINIATVEKDEIVIRIPQPVVAKNDLIISIDEDIESPDNYRKVFEALRTAKEGDVAYLNINSYGGYVCSMIQFFDAMLNTKAKTIGNVYTAYSAGSVIAMCCDEIRFKPFSSMMIHSMSTGTYGKISDVEGYAMFAIKQDIEITNSIYQGFLTKEEIKLVNKGKEIWLTQKEAEPRLKNFKSIKQRFLKTTN